MAVCRTSGLHQEPNHRRESVPLESSAGFMVARLANVWVFMGSASSDQMQLRKWGPDLLAGSVEKEEPGPEIFSNPVNVQPCEHGLVRIELSQGRQQ